MCKLHKVFYGLKQAPRAWFKKIDSFLKSQSFRKGTCDYNPYIVTLHSNIVIILLHVDDVLLTGSSLGLIIHVKIFLEANF